MPPRRRSSGWDHPVALTFLIFAVIGFLYFAAEVLKPLALAVLLSFALAPMVSRFQKLGLPRAAAAGLTVVVALGTLGLVSYVVWGQLSELANGLPERQERIEQKLAIFRPSDTSAAARLTRLADSVTSKLEVPPEHTKTDGDKDKEKDKDGPTETAALEPVAQANETDGLQPVRPVPVEIFKKPSFQERFGQAVGPVLEPLGIGSIVLILVLFMLIGKEDLRDRIVGLFGGSSISLTTRTMDEVGTRIGRYLGMFATVNTIFGLIIGLGLQFIGLEFAVLWGFLAGALRFIPYAGAATAFALPLIFSVAQFETWAGPLEVIALYAVIEIIANSYLEPVVYGKTTGLSAIGLLVAAMFWTWLWGPLGLLLSTPLTVCLAVLGKYVPALGIFATLLSEDSNLDPHVRFYQRILSLDQDGATEPVEAALKEKPRAVVFDEFLVPALSQGERDRSHNEIDGREQTFLWRVVRDILEDVDPTPPLALDVLTTTGTSAGEEPDTFRVAAVSANDEGDELALLMVERVLPAGLCDFEPVPRSDSSLKLANDIESRNPDLILISHLPPAGLTPLRYLVKRLRAHFPDVPLVVGHWGGGGDRSALAQPLTSVGATQVCFSIAEARDRIVEAARPRPAGDRLLPLRPSARV